MKETIKERLLSDKNIFLSIYLIDSYIQNRELLSPEERETLIRLKDIFDIKTIDKVVEDVKERLIDIVEVETKYFKVNVFFKPKKYDNSNIVFRPLHTSSLIDQIAMIAMLQILVYDISDDGKLVPSELSRLIPSNFYGNRIAFNGRQLFKSWQKQYQEYTSKSNEMLYRYCETLEYKYEVSLDLENFFPSINPQILYNFLCKHLPLKLSQEDNNTYKIIFKKLLIFELEELKGAELNWYLGIKGHEYDKLNMKQKCSYAKGMPQGLPHTYFMANVFMLLIKDTYAKALPGDMLFYVDDSVIYTNGQEGELNKENFVRIIEKINQSISEYEKQLLIEHAQQEDKIFPFNYQYSTNDFGVKVHDANKKSVFSEINIAKENAGERYLHGLCRETSKVGFDMFTTFSDEEISMLRSRTQEILNAINKEINHVGLNDSSNKVYIDKLIRYKKFFAYRKTILDYKNTGTIKELKKSIIKDISIRSSEEELQAFFERYTDDILASAIEFVFKRCTEESVNTDDLIDAVNLLNRVLYSDNSKHSYILKAYEQYLENKPEYYEGDVYKSLHKSIIPQYHSIREQSYLKKYARFKGDIDNYCINNYHELYALLKLERVFIYGEYVRLNSNNLERMILNCIFSYIFGYEIDDKFTLAKMTRNPIQYSEVRILAVLRNRNFNISNFLDNYMKYVESEYLQTADYSLLQVLVIFETFVSSPERIDSLILIHKYCCDTWKNGSKYLHFYTLHNQEHAVSLIRSSIKLLHAISYFKIKQIDYFILFASCYLHDISMVTLPDISKFYMGSNEKANCIYTDFINDIDIEDSTKTKKALCDAYQNIDEFFESDIRSNHSCNSAMEIRRYHELDFIDVTMRELIAEVSNGHGYDPADIYFVKSTGNTALVNEKFIKILLRLSDLLDMSRYRISKVILDHNLDNLNKTSRFHWISHLITDGYNLDTIYMPTEQPLSEGSSYLKKGSITEKLVLTVDVLMSQTTEVSITEKCKCIANSTLKLENDGKATVTIVCDNDKKCNNGKCNFLCKWFVAKNDYLFKELGALKRYLNSVKDNFYYSEIEVKIRAVSNTNIPNDTFDYLAEYIDTF